MPGRKRYAKPLPKDFHKQKQNRKQKPAKLNNDIQRKQPLPRKQRKNHPLPQLKPEEFTQNQNKKRYSRRDQGAKAPYAKPLPKDFIKKQQAQKKQQHKQAQANIPTKKQKAAEARQKYQREKEFRDLDQRLEQQFSMEMTEQEQLLSRFQRFESSLNPQEREILIRNGLEIREMIHLYSISEIYDFNYANPEFILLTQPARFDLLSQVIADKRANYADEFINYAGSNEHTAVTVEFFNNNITSPEDCDSFIDRVYTHENGRLFKCGFDFGTAIQRSEFILDDQDVPVQKRFKTTALSKYPLRGQTAKAVYRFQDENNSKGITNRIQLPDDNFINSCSNDLVQQRINQ